MAVHVGGRGPGHMCRVQSQPFAGQDLYLTDPAVVGNGFTVTQIYGYSQRTVYSDGTNYLNAADDSVISAWWLPYGATLHVDFVNSRFYWNGAVRAITDLTAVTGGYTLAGYDPGVVDGFTVTVEYVIPDTTKTISGTLFGSSGNPANGTGQRIELSAYDAQKSTRWYLPFTAGANFWAPPLQSKEPSEGGTVDGMGIRRITSALQAARTPQARTDNSMSHLSSNANASLNALNAIVPAVKLGFGNVPWATSSPLTNVTLRSVTIWPIPLPQSVTSVIQLGTPRKAVHFLGDSFLNLYKVLEQTKLLLDAEGIYTPTSQDGIGGTSLTQQSVRYAANDPRWHNSTLIIMDGGADYATGEPQTTVADKEATMQSAVNSILGRIPHNRWVYMGAAPNDDLGTQSRSDWDAVQNYMRSICGTHYVETLAYMQSLSDGSANDIDFVNRGRWPLSCQTSNTDFHPNAKGQAGLGYLMNKAIRDRGWL